METPHSRIPGSSNSREYIYIYTPNSRCLQLLQSLESPKFLIPKTPPTQVTESSNPQGIPNLRPQIQTLRKPPTTRSLGPGGRNLLLGEHPRLSGLLKPDSQAPGDPTGGPTFGTRIERIPMSSVHGSSDLPNSKFLGPHPQGNPQVPNL